MRETRTNVLVVGAGPVGLWTALQMAEAGLDVSVVDVANRTAARSYACALHPGTLRLLHKYGMAEEILRHSRQVRSIAFYDGADRKAQIQLAQVETDYPYLAILPQNRLEEALEARLRQAKVEVNWYYRFDDLKEGPERIVSVVEQLQGTSTGYIVPHWELVVKNRFEIPTDFVVGADGHNSLVRQRLKVDFQQVAGPVSFAAYEFEPEETTEDEIKIVLNPDSTNVLWPLPGNKNRWTFELPKGYEVTEFPQKERRAVHLANKVVDDRVRDYVQRIAGKRAPWFSGRVKEVTWATQVRFEQRMAKPVGIGRCWLAGDAAHQTGPIGVQSMNAGFFEGEALASAVREVVREGASAASLENYGRNQDRRWQRLLGQTGGLTATPKADSWVREHASRILPCLPGLDDDLVKLAGQVGLQPTW